MLTTEILDRIGEDRHVKFIPTNVIVNLTRTTHREAPNKTL